MVFARTNTTVGARGSDASQGAELPVSDGNWCARRQCFARLCTCRYDRAVLQHMRNRQHSSPHSSCRRDGPCARILAMQQGALPRLRSGKATHRMVAPARAGREQRSPEGPSPGEQAQHAEELQGTTEKGPNPQDREKNTKNSSGLTARRAGSQHRHAFWRTGTLSTLSATDTARRAGGS